MGFPSMIRIRQTFSTDRVDDPAAQTFQELGRVISTSAIKPGMRIAITAGSRGIANISCVIRAVASYVRELGGEPFVVPAMGSHGGATASGQKQVLASLGITEEYCGCPVISSMEVVEIGQAEELGPVFMDRQAWQSDGVILVGRVKPHTDFHSPHGLESGLAKMAVIGLGKHRQASSVHSFGVRGLRELIPRAAQVILQSGKILCGLAILENAREETAHIEAIPPQEIIRRESELLPKAAAMMPRLPVDRLDILVVDEIGKDYSGTGMDTNIIGRLRILGEDDPAVPDIRYIIASDLSAASHGNALGIGLADLTTKRLFEKIDLAKTNENVITSSFLHRAMIPIILPNDLAAIRTALRCSWLKDANQARIARIPNTLHLEYVDVSAVLLSEIRKQSSLEIVQQAHDWKFDGDGYLVRDWPN